jgi:hypothetical protein
MPISNSKCDYVGAGSYEKTRAILIECSVPVIATIAG